MEEDLWKNQKLDVRLRAFSSKPNVIKKLNYFDKKDYSIPENLKGFSKQVLPLQQYLSNNSAIFVIEKSSKNCQNSPRTYIEDLERDLIFKNPLSVELMADSFDLVDFQSFLESKEINTHDYYDYIKEEQNRNWAIQMIKEGITLSKQGKDSQALECYNQAIEVDPNNVDAFVALGALQCKLENFNDSIKQFNVALTIDPNHPNAKKYLQIAKVKFEDYNEKKRKEHDSIQAKIRNSNNNNSRNNHNLLSTSIEIPSISDEDDVIINDDIQLTQKLRTMMNDIHDKKWTEKDNYRENKEKSEKKDKKVKKDKKEKHKSRDKDKKNRKDYYSDKHEKKDKFERSENNDKYERNDKNDKYERNDKNDKYERNEKNDKYERNDKIDKYERNDNKDKYDYRDSYYSSNDRYNDKKRKRD